jgi:hypothetical protein
LEKLELGRGITLLRTQYKYFWHIPVSLKENFLKWILFEQVINFLKYFKVKC